MCLICIILFSIYFFLTSAYNNLCSVCVLYLFLGQLVTKIGFDEKEALGIAEGRGGRRGPENVGVAWLDAGLLSHSLCI